MEPHEVRVDALWKGGRTAPGSTTVGDFSAGDGELVVRGASRVAASKLGDAEGLVTMDKMLRVYRYKTNKLALRALVDEARQKAWRDAAGSPWFDRKAVDAWMATNRADGQTDASWGLRVRALDAAHPSWRDAIGLDGDMLATMSAPEYGKVLCAASHEFTADEKEAAVMAVQPDLVGMYKSVLAFVRKADA